MADEIFVDLRYQGVDVGQHLHFENILATRAYLHSPAPMPVGTVLVVDGGDHAEMTVRVTRVNEQVSGSERPSGMYVEPYELSADAQEHWNRWAGTEASEPSQESVTEAPSESESVTETVTESVTESEAASMTEAASESGSEPKGKKSKKKRKSRKKSK